MRHLAEPARLARVALLGALCAALVPAAGARTVIQNKGSDSLAIAVQAWADAYRWVDRDTGIAVNAGGSGTGIAALLDGTADIANSSRPMSAAERERARARGREPVEHVVGRDVVAVVVHPDNPLRTLDFAQLGELFARRGELERWTDLGVTVPGCQDQVIVRVGRQSSSGTYAYFRARALAGEKYRQGTLAVQGTRHVVDLVARTPCAIGYASLAYVRPEVRVVCLRPDAGEPCARASIEAARHGSYALVRPLYMYTVADSREPVQRYLQWILGDEGQCVIARRGYVSLRPATCPD